MGTAMATLERDEVAVQTDLSAMTLDELQLEVENEHRAVESALAGALEHAIRCGEALLAAKERCPAGEWMEWSERAGLSGKTMRKYMRVAYYAERIAGTDIDSITQALKYLTGMPSLPHGTGAPDWLRAKAVEMREGGATYAAVCAEVGVTRETVARWVDPSRVKERQHRAYAKRKQANLALKREERDRAMKKRGGSIAEAYSLIRKAAQQLDLACADLTDAEQREEVTAALAALHSNVEDRIVRALGIE